MLDKRMEMLNEFLTLSMKPKLYTNLQLVFYTLNPKFSADLLKYVVVVVLIKEKNIIVPIIARTL